MRFNISSLLALSTLTLISPAISFASTGVTAVEFASPAPNAYGSPSYPGWQSNAVNALENNLSSVGNPVTDPTAYYQVTTGTDSSNVVTDYNSWNGLANPTGAFASELGNRLQFGVRFDGNGTPIALANLAFNMVSSDPGDELGYSGDFSDPSDPSDVYSPSRVGIIHGISGDTFITSGPATQLVDEIVYVGVGDAVAPEDIGSSNTGQAGIDDVAAFYDSIMPFTFSTTYTLTDGLGGTLATSSASVVFGTPEPTSIALLGSGALLLIKRRRR
jgi:PEP-CTERM motif